jgi:hypothetical protein
VTTAVYPPGFPRARESGRNVPVWYCFSVTESEQARMSPLAARNILAWRNTPGPRLSPRVSAGHANDPANAQRIGDMRRGHEANMPATCINTEERCSR